MILDGKDYLIFVTFANWPLRSSLQAIYLVIKLALENQ